MEWNHIVASNVENINLDNRKIYLPHIFYFSKNNIF